MKAGLIVKLSPLLVLFNVVVFNASFARAQTSSRQVGAILDQQMQLPAVTAFQLGQYLAAKIPALPAPQSGDQWTAEATRLRRQILEDSAVHGWPGGCVEARRNFQVLAPTQSGEGD